VITHTETLGRLERACGVGGLICRGTDSDSCLDYEVRYACPAGALAASWRPGSDERRRSVPNQNAGLWLGRRAADCSVGGADVEDASEDGVANAPAVSVISGNSGPGVVALGPRLVLTRSYIGLAADGVSPIPNTGFGVEFSRTGSGGTLGNPGLGPAPAPGSIQAGRVVVSGNRGGGIRSVAKGLTILSAFVGLSASGGAIVPNTGNGIDAVAWELVIKSPAPATLGFGGLGAVAVAGNTAAGILVRKQSKPPKSWCKCSVLLAVLAAGASRMLIPPLSPHPSSSLDPGPCIAHVSLTIACRFAWQPNVTLNQNRKVYTKGPRTK